MSSHREAWLRRNGREKLLSMGAFTSPSFIMLKSHTYQQNLSLSPKNKIMAVHLSSDTEVVEWVGRAEAVEEDCEKRGEKLLLMPPRI